MSKTVQQSIQDRIASRNLRVAVLGLGYVGLPLAVAFAEAGFQITGIDIDEKKVLTSAVPPCMNIRRAGFPGKLNTTCPPSRE